MARYLQVSNDIAESIASGKLPAGDELPSIRQAARRYDTTATTIGRAYRHLADASVIDVSDRRRSRVAAAGQVAARRLLSGSAVLHLAGSDDPALDVVLRNTGTSVAAVGARGSFHA
jgi:DNA-binding GntR family transcriptional regulator